MALPTSRNTSYTASAPVKSADLNDLQDAIVAAWHGDVSLWLPAPLWQVETGGSGGHVDGTYTFGGATTIVCPLVLPVGTFIDAIDWHYNRNSAGTVTTSLRRRNIVTGAAAADVGAANADSTGAALEVFNQDPNHTIETDYAYWLRVNCSNVANVFWGARLAIRKGP